ncbi:MAG: ABC transporter permease [Geoalkalibacter sp.]|uniref:ABC transporter permease n=1 Tax=Geoalkalibacter sp. TaxID=3041440 RepID=UPI003D144543
MILTRSTLRQTLRHPLQWILAVIGVALGVAVVIGIDLANSSAERAFRLSAQTLSGSATHHIVGGPTGLDEKIYRRLRVDLGYRFSAPVVEGYANLKETDLPRTVRLLGVDPFAESPFRSYTSALEDSSAAGQLLTQSNSVFLTHSSARQMGRATGQTLTVETAGRTIELKILGTLAPRDQTTDAALADTIITDIATAQEVLAQIGRLSRIELIIDDDANTADTLSAIEAILPPTASLVHASARSETMAQMTRAFQLNLTALSLLALVVGMFLIYNTMTFSVLRRRTQLGILRTLGVTRRHIFLLVLGEALTVGAAGSILGVLLGYALGHGLLGLVTRTINDLYFVLNVRDLTLSPWSLTKGLVLGLGATLAAAVVPSLEATRSQARAVMARSALESRHRHRLVPLVSIMGAALLATGAGSLALPGKSLLVGFGALFVLISGYALVVPVLMIALMKGLQNLFNPFAGVLGRMALRAPLASLSRTGVATAALVVAVAATVGVGIMINSFRLTVDQWLNSFLRADIYITAAGGDFEEQRAPLPQEVIDQISSTEGVEKVTHARHLRMEAGDEPFELFVAEIPRESFDGYWFADGARKEIRQEFDRTTAVIVSEPFAYHRDLKRGDVLEMQTMQGPVSFRIAGVFTDYSSDRGRVTIRRDLFEHYWGDPGSDALGLYLKPGEDAEAVAETLRRHAAVDHQILVYSNRALRKSSLATFDRTFAITGVLRLLAVIVAFVGILSALMAMQIERSRELGILRALGLTPRQLWIMVSTETGLMGLIAGLLALPLGIIQALVLILVINRRSFGWTMQTAITGDILWQAIVLAVGAAVLAGIYPAWRMARSAPALALREE